MRIEITVPVGNPWKTLCLVVITVWILLPGKDPDANAQGGEQKDAVVIAQAEQNIDRERIKQAVLERREEILRYQLMKLEEEANTLTSPHAKEALSEHRQILIELIKERQQSEALLKESLIELWEAQGVSITESVPVHTLVLEWPIEPTYGLSARFGDPIYKERFGLDHYAIDIPIEQGSPIRAPADGIIKSVQDNGLGYSFIAIDHRDGVETIYGHVSGFLVQEGQRVSAGDPIALSGGRPGSRGAGLLTTGPHLHFAVRQDGKLADPLAYLRQWRGLKDFVE